MSRTTSFAVIDRLSKVSGRRITKPPRVIWSNPQFGKKLASGYSQRMRENVGEVLLLAIKHNA
jgi:hypothetical protein